MAGQLDPIQLMRKIAELEDKINALRTIEIGGVWKDWTPTLTGWSAEPSGALYRYCLVGKLCTLMIRQGTSGTSNATNAIITAPFASLAGGSYWSNSCQFRNNSTTSATPGFAQIGNGSSNIIFYTTWVGGTWTASNEKAILNCVLTYEIA